MIEYKSSAEPEFGSNIDQNQSTQLTVVNPLQQSCWDDLLATHPGGSFFHTAAWAKVLNETYGYEPLYFTVRGGNRLLALLPIMEVRSRLTGCRGISLPFTDTCELLDSGTFLKDKVIPRVLRHGKEVGWRYFECRGGKPNFETALPFQSFFTHELKLLQDENYLFSRLDSAARRAIRRAQKANVAIDFSHSIDAVREFYSLQCLTRKKHGLPPQPFRFFEQIWKHIIAQHKGVVILARYQGRVFAGAVYFAYGSAVLYKYGASDGAFQDLRGNNLVMWEGIKWAARHGANSFHFGRTDVANEGLRRYKLGWGVEERLVNYYRYQFCKQTFVCERDKGSRLKAMTFRNLPIFLSKRIGSILYRHAA